MAILFQSSSSSILSIKIFLISTTVLSAAIMLKISAPAVTDFAVSEVPSIWKGVVSWLKPPYLYLVINCIIITIVASSKLQNKLDDENSSPVVSPENLAQFNAIKDVVESRPMVYEYPVAGVYDAKVEKVPEVNPYDDVDVRILENDKAFAYQEPKEVVVEKDVDVLISKSYRAPVMRQDSIDYSSERPPASARFSHRKNGKSTPEGGKGALRVSKPKRQDTLESTWKTITEGRAMPLTRHLRKSDTWETHGGRNPVVTPPQQKMKKSETFNDHTTPDSPLLTPSPGSGKLKKEPSLSQDELNRRVEAFIKKFNEDMRLQRQQSLQQYTEMINRGSH
ncbi:uncharacterized protein LOC132037190 isoform X2 [Lycium ferocissimum]|uniref:uncharacterized protein LOC132037190 isoform X2 n=1 Tax=Lycium ferocissimum TaxID=112874 RepID=UPI0028167D04|nr:uncharacterized protein LOC132037190 isoform X2 [Lycium ferocissimum]